MKQRLENEDNKVNIAKHIEVMKKQKLKLSIVERKETLSTFEMSEICCLIPYLAHLKCTHGLIPFHNAQLQLLFLNALDMFGNVHLVVLVFQQRLQLL